MAKASPLKLMVRSRHLTICGLQIKLFLSFVRPNGPYSLALLDSLQSLE